MKISSLPVPTVDDPDILRCELVKDTFDQIQNAIVEMYRVPGAIPSNLGPSLEDYMSSWLFYNTTTKVRTFPKSVITSKPVGPFKDSKHASKFQNSHR